MFCPDCGAENSKSQKFCRNCGTNLIAIDRARDIVNEVTTSGANTPSISPLAVFAMVAIIVTVGFIVTTIGVVSLMRIDDARTPIPVMFGIGGFVSLVLICKYLLKMLSYTSASSGNSRNRTSLPSAYSAPPPSRGETNRRLSEPSSGYHSIIDDPTKQFETERQR